MRILWICLLVALTGCSTSQPGVRLSAQAVSGSGASGTPWRVVELRPLPRISGAAIISRDNKKLLAENVFVEIERGEAVLLPFQGGSTLRSWALSSDGRLAAAFVSGWRGERGTERWYGVSIADVANPGDLRTVELPESAVGLVMFNRANTHIAAVAFGATYIVNVASGKVERRLGIGDYRDFALSPDFGQYAVVQTRWPETDRQAKLSERGALQVVLFNTATGKEVRRYEPLQGRSSFRVMFSGDGTHLLMGECGVLELATGRFHEQPMGLAVCVYEPMVEGRYVLMRGEQASAVWDVKRGKVHALELPEVTTDEQRMVVEALSADGTTVVVNRYSAARGRENYVARLIRE